MKFSGDGSDDVEDPENSPTPKDGRKVDSNPIFDNGDKRDFDQQETFDKE